MPLPKEWRQFIESLNSNGVDFRSWARSLWLTTVGPVTQLTLIS